MSLHDLPHLDWPKNVNAEDREDGHEKHNQHHNVKNGTNAAAYLPQYTPNAAAVLLELDEL